MENHHQTDHHLGPKMFASLFPGAWTAGEESQIQGKENGPIVDYSWPY